MNTQSKKNYNIILLAVFFIGISMLPGYAQDTNGVLSMKLILADQTTNAAITPATTNIVVWVSATNNTKSTIQLPNAMSFTPLDFYPLNGANGYEFNGSNSPTLLSPVGLAGQSVSPGETITQMIGTLPVSNGTTGSTVTSAVSALASGFYYINLALTNYTGPNVLGYCHQLFRVKPIEPSGDPAVVAAKNTIDNYFKNVLAGQSVGSAKSLLSAIMATLSTSDQLTVHYYYYHASVRTAGKMIHNYFTSLAAGQTVTDGKTLLQTIMPSMLRASDAQTVDTDYFSTSVTTVENMIDNYFAANLAAGKAVTGGKAFLQTIMPSVLRPVDSSTVDAYYFSSEVPTADQIIDNYFAKFLSTGQAATDGLTFMNALMPSVLLTTDSTAVDTYYFQASVTAAEKRIDNYFTALSAGQNVGSAKNLINNIIFPVLNRTLDKQTVQNYFNQKQATANIKS